MNFIPARGKILIKRTQKKNVSSGGVELPATSMEIPHDGVIVACGLDCADWKPGDRVFYAQFHDEEIDIEETRYHIIRKEHIQGVLNVTPPPSL